MGIASIGSGIATAFGQLTGGPLGGVEAANGTGLGVDLVSGTFRGYVTRIAEGLIGGVLVLIGITALFIPEATKAVKYVK